MLHSQQSQKSVKNVRWLLNFSRTNQGLNMFGKANSQMPNTGASTAKGLEKNQGLRKPQVDTQAPHWVAGGLRHVPWILWTSCVTLRGRESARLHHPIVPSSTKVWGKSLLLLENHRGFTFLNKTEKKALQKTLSWKELQFCLLKTLRAQDISDSRVCICLEVQGVSKVFLNTNRILGQHPVRRDGSQT